MRFIEELVGLIAFFMVARSAIAAIGGMARGSAPNPPQPPQAATATDIRTSGELHKDPTCGTFVAASTAYTVVEDGVLLYFCSKECRDRFQSGRNSKRWGKSTTVRS
jgi:YHS domain-containing protein